MTESALAFQVDARLDADDHVLGEHVGASPGNPGRLVVAQADPVPRAVETAFLTRIPLRAEEVVDGRIDLAACDAGSDHPEGESRRASLHGPEGRAGLPQKA